MQLIPTKLEDIGTWRLLRSGWSWALLRDWRLPLAWALLAVTISYLWFTRINGIRVLDSFRTPIHLPPETPYYELGSVIAPAIAAIFTFILVVIALRKPSVPHRTGYFLTGLALILPALAYITCLAGLAGTCGDILIDGRFSWLQLIVFALYLLSEILVMIELIVGLKKHRWVWPGALLFHQTAAVLLMALSYHTTVGWWVDVIK